MALVAAWRKTATLPDLLPPVHQLVLPARPSLSGSRPISVRGLGEGYETAGAPVGDVARLVLSDGSSASGSRGITIQQTI